MELEKSVLPQVSTEVDDKPTFEKVWMMVQETSRNIEKMRLENDRRMQETDRQMKETDRRIKEIHDELGGIGKSNGEIAEDFFYSALKQSMKINNMEFEEISRNLHHKRKNLEGEYDIILYNSYKILVVEVKYRFRYEYLYKFYTDKLKLFKSLFPQYKDHKLYGAIAAMSFEKGTKAEAEKYGFFVFTQSNEYFKVLNPEEFIPHEIR